MSDIHEGQVGRNPSEELRAQFPEFYAIADDPGQTGVQEIYLSAPISEERRFELLALLPEGIYEFYVEEIDGQEKHPSNS